MCFKQGATYLVMVAVFDTDIFDTVFSHIPLRGSRHVLHGPLCTHKEDLFRAGLPSAYVRCVPAGFGFSP